MRCWAWSRSAEVADHGAPAMKNFVSSKPATEIVGRGDGDAAEQGQDGVPRVNAPTGADDPAERRLE